MEITVFSEKKRKYTKNHHVKHPPGSQLLCQGVAEVLCCHILGQQYFCPCGNKPKDFNKVKTCPRDKRLIRANGSGLNTKSVWICLSLWLCLKNHHSRSVTTSLLEWTWRFDTSRLLFYTFPTSSARHHGRISQRKLMCELAVVEAEIQPKPNPPDLNPV